MSEVRTAGRIDRAVVQRRTVLTLLASQALGALGISIGVATASLLARDLSGSDEMAGLAQTSQGFGAAIASWLLARLMARSGRRAGLTTGYLLGATGAGLAVLSGVADSMLLLVLGALLIGSVNSANLAARYAATDLATNETRGRSLSLVVWATTIGAVLGPNLTGTSADLADWLGVPELTGPFVIGAGGMLLAAVVVWIRMRPDPLQVARALAVQEAERAERARPASVPAPAEPTAIRQVLRRHPVLIAAIAGLAAAHAVMTSVMVMTPLHMEHGGAELRVIGIVISVHVLGMFAFSPLVGMAADRFGRPPVMAAGGIVLLVSLVLCARAPEGNSPEIFAGLFLLGLGWSMATVAAATLVAERTPLSSRPQVQGTADLLMAAAAAGGSAASGVIVHEFGYPMLAGYSALFAAGVVAAAWFARRR